MSAVQNGDHSILPQQKKCNTKGVKSQIQTLIIPVECKHLLQLQFLRQNGQSSSISSTVNCGYLDKQDKEITM